MNSSYPLQFTQAQVEARRSDYVCFACGRQFLTDAQLEQDRYVTCSMDQCGLCGKEAGTTHIRAFNWLRIANPTEVDAHR